MPIQFHEENGGKILVTQATGKMSKADYKPYVAEIERLLEKHGKLRVLADITEFHSLSSDAFLEDLKLYANHISDLERIAVVGNKQWEQVVTNLGKPFIKTRMRYFDQTEADEARKWLAEA